MTETVAAACSGVIRQPSMSISTSRNSAAVSAAEIRPRATLGPMRGRPAWGAPPRASATGPRSTGIASSAAGVCARKIACQEMASVSAPPRAGPIGGAERTGRGPRGDGPGLRPRGPRQELERRADHGRAADRLHAAGGDEHLERRCQRAAPARRRRRPAGRRRRPRAGGAGRCSAAGTATSASTRLKDVMTHATDAISTSNSRRISGRARITIDESASTMPVATASPSVSRSLLAERLQRDRAHVTSA